MVDFDFEKVEIFQLVVISYLKTIAMTRYKNNSNIIGLSKDDIGSDTT